MPQPDSFNNISENFMDYIVKNEKSIYIIRRKTLIKGYFPIEGNDNFSMTVECEDDNEAEEFVQSIFDEFNISREEARSIYEKIEELDEHKYKVTATFSNLRGSNIDISIYFKKICE